MVYISYGSAAAIEFEQEGQQQHFELREVTLANVRFDYDEYDQLLRTLVRCKNLTSLVSREISSIKTGLLFQPLVSLERRHYVVERGPIWKHLTRLGFLDCFSMSDEQIGSFLGSLAPGLTSLSLKQTRFADVSFHTLMQHHSKTLTRLDLSSDPKGHIVHGILCTCEVLESICGMELPISNLTRCDDSEHDQGCLGSCRQWVCKNLQEWNIDIYNDVADRPAVLEFPTFARLSSLTKVKSLKLKTSPENNWVSSSSVDWSNWSQ